MIRDPSDGTVREKPVLETETSGLPMSRGKSDYLARLERSREWLKEYRTASHFASPAGEVKMQTTTTE